MTLPMWVIYERPRDYPSGWVVRCWFVNRHDSNPVPGEATYHDSLPAARAVLPLGCFQLDRHPNDDPAIVEVWL